MHARDGHEERRPRSFITSSESAWTGRRRSAAAIEDALRAPSILNTQPWRWRVGDNTSMGAVPV